MNKIELTEVEIRALKQAKKETEISGSISYDQIIHGIIAKLLLPKEETDGKSIKKS